MRTLFCTTALLAGIAMPALAVPVMTETMVLNSTLARVSVNTSPLLFGTPTSPVPDVVVNEIVATSGVTTAAASARVNTSTGRVSLSGSGSIPSAEGGGSGGNARSTASVRLSKTAFNTGSEAFDLYLDLEFAGMSFVYSGETASGSFAGGAVRIFDILVGGFGASDGGLSPPVANIFDVDCTVTGTGIGTARGECNSGPRSRSILLRRLAPGESHTIIWSFEGLVDQFIVAFNPAFASYSLTDALASLRAVAIDVPPPPPPPPPVDVPEPAAIGLFGLALLGLGQLRRWAS